MATQTRRAPNPGRVLNYTTTITVEKTIIEISAILIAHGATQIIHSYDGYQIIHGLAFRMNIGDVEREFRISPHLDNVVKRMVDAHNKGKRKYTRAWWDLERLPAGAYDQARRTAWRILKDALEVMFNLSDAGIADPGQLLFGFGTLDSGETIYEAFIGRDRALPNGVH
jgi:hypothetical protein